MTDAAHPLITGQDGDTLMLERLRNRLRDLHGLCLKWEPDHSSGDDRQLMSFARDALTGVDDWLAGRGLVPACPAEQRHDEGGHDDDFIEREDAWLIEHGASDASSPLYWCGFKLDTNPPEPREAGEWTKDHLLAVRFARQIDAQRAASTIDHDPSPPPRVAGHSWIGGPSSTGPAASPGLHVFKPHAKFPWFCDECGYGKGQSGKHPPAQSQG